MAEGVFGCGGGGGELSLHPNDNVEDELVVVC